MENNKRTRRTPEQLIADAQSRLDKLQAKAAESEAASNPLLAPLLDEIKDRGEQRVRLGLLLGRFSLQLGKPRLCLSDKLVRSASLSFVFHVGIIP